MGVTTGIAMILTKYGVERRCVDDEHGEGGTANDSRKVPVVSNEWKTKGDLELGFDGKHVEALAEENGQVD